MFFNIGNENTLPTTYLFVANLQISKIYSPEILMTHKMQ